MKTLIIIVILFSGIILNAQILPGINKNAGIVSDMSTNSERNAGYINYSLSSESYYLTSSTEIKSISIKKDDFNPILNRPYGMYPYQIWMNGVDPQNYFNYMAQQKGLLPQISDKPNALPKFPVKYIKGK